MNECKIVSISNTLLKIYEGNAAQLLGWFSGTESWIKNGQKQLLSVPVEVVTMIFRLEKDGTEGTKIGDWMLCVFNGFWQYGSRETKHVTVQPFKRFRVDYPIDIGGTKELGMR